MLANDVTKDLVPGSVQERTFLWKKNGKMDFGEKRLMPPVAIFGRKCALKTTQRIRKKEFNRKGK